MNELKELLKGLSKEEYKEVAIAIGQAKNADDIIAVAKTKGVDIAKDLAEEIYTRLNADEDVSDEELSGVSGGAVCEEKHGCGAG